MILTIRITDLDGGTRTVEAGFREQIAYERFTGKTIPSWVTEPPGIYDFAVLGWITETSQGMPFEAWTDTVSMAILEGSTSANPTRGGASTG